MNPVLLASVMGDLMSSPSSSPLTTSSSSSDTDSDEEFFELQKLLERKKRNSVLNFVEEVVANYSDEEFRSHFRMHRQTAELITQQFAASRHYKKRYNSGGRKPMSAETQCLSFLWFAGSNDCYRQVSNLFNFTFSSAYRSQTAFMEFLFDISKRYIKMPKTNSEKEKISREFKKLAGLDNVVGAIDGAYINIRKPAHTIRSKYLNHHGNSSITLQGICDADKKFLDVFVGATSKIHDSRVYKLSHIYSEIPKICGNNYHIVGDGAYPLREYMLTPYRDYGDLSTQHKKYNKKHAETRLKIDNTFGLLKQRFRQLARLDFFTVLRMSKFVLGCCVLHNLCIDTGDLWEEADCDTSTSTSTTEEQRSEEEISRSMCEDGALEAVLFHRGQVKRNRIAQTL